MLIMSKSDILFSHAFFVFHCFYSIVCFFWFPWRIGCRHGNCLVILMSYHVCCFCVIPVLPSPLWCWGSDPGSFLYARQACCHWAVPSAFSGLAFLLILVALSCIVCLIIRDLLAGIVYFAFYLVRCVCCLYILLNFALMQLNHL